jgi:hypothetical protein
LASAVLGLSAIGVRAQTGSAPAWQDLTPAQQRALSPLRGQWSRIDAARRQSWLDVANRMPSLSAAEQARLQARMAAWSSLSPAERGTARLQYQEAQRWSPQERQARWEAYQSLHPQARQILAERWKLEVPDGRQTGTASADSKRNVVEPPPPPVAPPRAASPTSVRSRSGATTHPMLEPAAEPAHHQPGLPKIVATDPFVDPATLLPKRGPQGAAMAAPPAAQPAPPR